MYDNIKTVLEDDSVFYVLLILLIGVTSFGLGRYSASQVKVSTEEPKVVMTTIATSSVTKPNVVTSGQLVASKKGSKYHLPQCPGASQMKEENKIYFSSKEDAEAAGYTAAANCEF